MGEFQFLVFDTMVLTYKRILLLLQVQFMKQIAENLDCDDVIENLIKIAMYMLNANEMR